MIFILKLFRTKVVKIQLHFCSYRFCSLKKYKISINQFQLGLLFKIVLYQNIISYATILVQHFFVKNIPNAELVQHN